MMEVSIQSPTDKVLRDSIIFDTKFQDTSKLIDNIPSASFDCKELNEVSSEIQENIQTSDHIKNYVEFLWQATENPKKFAVDLEGIDMDDFLVAGSSPRGMIMLIKAAKVNAWMNNRDHVQPVDVEYVFHAVMAHRLVVNRIYENNKTELLEKFTHKVLLKVATPKLD